MSVYINVINTNAQSLCPKINSLVDCFEELDGTIAIVTEMSSPGPELVHVPPHLHHHRHTCDRAQQFYLFGTVLIRALD